MPARRPGMRVGPLAGLCTSRSTGPITLTVTPSIGAPPLSVTKITAVVVAPPVARGRGACTAGFGFVGDGGCGLAVGGAACSKVSNKRATIPSMIIRYGAITKSSIRYAAITKSSMLTLQMHPAEMRRVVLAVGPVVPVGLDFVLRNEFPAHVVHVRGLRRVDVAAAVEVKVHHVAVNLFGAHARLRAAGAVVREHHVRSVTVI